MKLHIVQRGGLYWCGRRHSGDADSLYWRQWPYDATCLTCLRGYIHYTERLLSDARAQLEAQLSGEESQ